MTRRSVLCALLVSVFATGWVIGQEGDFKPTLRLPNNYGRIGLSEAQKGKIYGIQAKYAKEIDAILKQVEELRAKRDAEMETILTAEQRAELKTYLEEAKKTPAEKKAKAKSTPATPTPTVPTESKDK